MNAAPLNLVIDRPSLSRSQKTILYKVEIGREFNKKRITLYFSWGL